MTNPISLCNLELAQQLEKKRIKIDQKLPQQLIYITYKRLYNVSLNSWFLILRSYFCNLVVYINNWIPVTCG